MTDEANLNVTLPEWAQDLVPPDRPLAVFDLETTGTVIHMDRIVEIGICQDPA